MKHKHIFIVFSFSLLTALVACGPTPATLAPSSLGAGQINNNSSGPIQLAATPIPSPYYTKPAPSGCVQFGCAYPAVCDQTTGQCVINNSGPATLPPVAKAPGGVPPVAINPGNAPSIPQLGCSPTVPSISQITSFCANQAAGLGGATFDYSPSAGVINYAFGKNASCNYSNQNSKATCSGPQGGQLQELYCTSCGGGDAPGSPVFANSSCSKGYAKDATGNCQPTDPSQEYSPCPTGSHYDNGKQYCVDNVSGQDLADLCPAGTQTYLPDYHYCLPNNYPEVYNCQTFAIPLGSCAVIKKAGSGVCQPPAGGCGYNVNGSPKQWNQATCSCQ